MNRKQLRQIIVVAIGSAMIVTALFTSPGAPDITTVLLLLFGLTAIIAGGLFLGPPR